MNSTQQSTFRIEPNTQEIPEVLPETVVLPNGRVYKLAKESLRIQEEPKPEAMIDKVGRYFTVFVNSPFAKVAAGLVAARLISCAEAYLLKKVSTTCKDITLPGGIDAQSLATQAITGFSADLNRSMFVDV